MPKGSNRCIKKIYGTLHSSKRKIGSKEFPHQIGSADIR